MLTWGAYEKKLEELGKKSIELAKTCAAMPDNEDDEPDPDVAKITKDVVREAFRLFFPPSSSQELHLVSTVGKAGNSQMESIPDMFVFPSQVDWDVRRVPRAHWWVRASFLIKFRERGLDEFAHLGQCVQYAKELLRCCPTRQYGVVVLFSLKFVRTIIVNRTRGNVEITPHMHVDRNKGLASFMYAAKEARTSSLLPWPLARLGRSA